jgi:membrane protein YqaA with SNARE-associated domain
VRCVICYNAAFQISLKLPLMNSIKLPHWLQGPVTAIAAAGGPGLFLIALLDSTFLPLPSVSDVLMIEFSIHYPARMPYYAIMSTFGSLAGCLILYFLARKGGELYFRKHAGARADRIRGWVANNGFLTMTIGALAPPPTPFKLIVLAAGALDMPLSKFAFALLFARAIRFFGEGYLAIRYGDQASTYLMAHKIAASCVVLGLVLAVYIIGRLAGGPAKKAG